MATHGQFTMSAGVASRIAGAIDKRNDEGYDVLLSGGDLHQMGIWDSFLRSKGVDVGQRDCYPAVKSEDAEQVYRLLWENRVEGWWNLQRELVSCGICTEDEYRAALKKE